MVAGGRRPPSRIAGRILRVFDHQAPRAIKSPSPWFFSARATKRALALYTITIDRMYDSKAWRRRQQNKLELYALVNPKLKWLIIKKTALEVFYYWRNEVNYWQTRSIARPLCDSRASCSLRDRHRNIAITFGMEKLEWCVYPTVKKWGYKYSFWHNTRTWQTDGRTDTAWRHRPRLPSRGKKWVARYSKMWGMRALRTPRPNMTPMLTKTSMHAVLLPGHYWVVFWLHST